MKCPYCNSEMQKGYIHCRDGLYWTPKRQLVSALASLAIGAVPIGDDDLFKRNKQAFAYNCTNCMNVIIPYGREN